MRIDTALVAGILLLAVACKPRAEPRGGGMAEDSLHVATADDSAFRSAGDTLRSPVELPPFAVAGGSRAIGMDGDSVALRDSAVARIDTGEATRLMAPAEPRRK